ncbi:flagella biosynthesis regulatory protein FliT [Superficieibacter sp.]|uniref:flagella biosynthesis regulatory protein FliT n=1 Tax=Superficieibacter sp. TaxID=2303322 RepID=UPI0028A9EDC5|nr:flagella biosynthesis regulatory protein FliT [Superficieibacter sp.]
MNNNLTPSLKNWHVLHTLSLTMLQLAEAGQWDELIEHEVSYVQLVEEIANNPISASNKSQFEQGRFILEQILSNEAQLKQLLQERMADLRHLIHQSGNQLSVTTTYGNMSGNILFPNNSEA